MVPPPQLPHSVSRETVDSAVSALTKWMKKRAAEAPPNLLADERDDIVLLQLSLRRIPAASTTKPRLLPLPHPVIAHSDASVCAISDDSPKSRSPSASDLLDKSKSLHFPISEVIPFSKLRTDYRPYESRRRLAGFHDLFIADRAILPQLPRHLGKAFYSTKKVPIGVDFTRVGWLEQVQKVLVSSFLYLRTGTCSTMKVGRLDMKEEDIVENVIAAVEAAVNNVPKKWANVRALHLKALDSVALPIYQAVPELGMKIEVPHVAQLEGATREVVDAAESFKMARKKKKVLKDANRVAEEKSGKRKQDKKRQNKDVVMQEEVQTEPEKKKSKSDVAPIEEGQKVGKKGKRALEKEAEASKDNKKGRKSEPALEESSSMGKKGKKEDTKHESNGDVMEVANIKNKKGKSKEGKNKKNIKGGGDDYVESLEDKKSKGKKLDGEKIKKARTGVRV